MTKTTYKSKDVRWERNLHHLTPTFTWVHLKKTTATRSLRIISHAITDLNSETALKKAFLQLNQVHPSIKFVCKYSSANKLP